MPIGPADCGAGLDVRPPREANGRSLYCRAMTPKALFETAKHYFQKNPDELRRIVRNAFGLRLSVPLDAIRWLAEQAVSKGAAAKIEVESLPPGFKISAELEAMKTPVRAGAVIYIERVRVSGTELRIEVRLQDVTLKLAGESFTPVALLIKSGALDLTRPGNFVRHAPNLPAFLIEAHDNKIVLDFMKHPAIANNPLARGLISALTSVVTLHGVETDEGHVDVMFRAFPDGVRHAAKSLREHLFAPAAEKVRGFLPVGR